MGVVKIGDSAFFVPSYSEYQIMRAYTVETTVQSLDLGYTEEQQDTNPPEKPEDQPPTFG